MSKGLIAPGIVGCIAVSCPHCSALGAIAITRAALRCPPRRNALADHLALRSLPEIPELFMQWFWVNNLGRYFGFAHLGAQSEPWFYTRTLPWFAWPALPLALWARGGSGRKD